MFIWASPFLESPPFNLFTLATPLACIQSTDQTQWDLYSTHKLIASRCYSWRIVDLISPLELYIICDTKPFLLKPLRFSFVFIADKRHINGFSSTGKYFSILSHILLQKSRAKDSIVLRDQQWQPTRPVHKHSTLEIKFEILKKIGCRIAQIVYN